MNHIQQGLFDASKIMDVKDVVALEQKIASEDTPLLELMKRAGAAMEKAAMDAMPAGATGNVVVFAGTGNNGGDGWVAAELIAADCPSGLNAQTGRPSSPTVKADTTVTMLAVKTGLVQSTARHCVGELILAPLV